MSYSIQTRMLRGLPNYQNARIDKDRLPVLPASKIYRQTWNPLPKHRNPIHHIKYRYWQTTSDPGQGAVHKHHPSRISWDVWPVPRRSVLFEYLLPTRKKNDCRPPGVRFLLEQPLIDTAQWWYLWTRNLCCDDLIACFWVWYDEQQKAHEGLHIPMS